MADDNKNLVGGGTAFKGFERKSLSEKQTLL